MMKDFEPPSQRRDSAASIKLQSQLSNLTYRVSKSRSGTTAIPADPHYDLVFDVNVDGIPPCQVQLKTSKHTRADELLRHVLHQLSSSGYQRKAVDCYTLSEVVYDDVGQVCKERRLTSDDHPAQLQLLWPKDQNSPGSSDTDSSIRETYAFRICESSTDSLDQAPHSPWLECDLASYFASDSYLHKFFSDDNTVADLCQLPELTEPTILADLKERFDEGRIYTSAGPSILVSINPYKFYPLYNPKVVSLYQTDVHPSLKLPPHIFAIADTAYNTMLRYRRDQCVVISGESGSGKTECTHFILHHLTALSHKGQQGGKVEQSILSAAPVLEAFGNAKTAHNNNSSRFGKYIQVFYKPDGKVCRANVQQYLLEKSRIVTQARNERNYHVFYYMLAGSNEEEKRKLQLGSIDSYDYLNQSDFADMNGVDCTFELDRLKQAMEMVGFTREIQTRIFSVLSAVLHIGNIQYVKKASSYHHDESVIIQNRDVLAMVASLLQVNEELLHSALISKCAIAYNEALIMNYKLPEAVNARDALAKLLYCSLFDWIVNQTNRLLSSGSKIAKDKEVSIGVLDIFGFENFERNSFEQFCINYANEHLQSYFNLHVFKYEQEEYLNEGIEWNKIAYTDNTPCLDLIQQKPYGLLPLLNEECNFPGATNETLLEKYRRHQVTNEYFDSPQKRENAFIVHHYAGTVKYDVKNFREKNSDANRAADLVTLLKTSLSGFLREMVAESPTAMARWRMLKLTVFTVLAFTRKVRRRSSFSLEGLSSSPPKGAMVLAERGSLTGGSIQGKAPVPLGVKRNFSPQSVSRQHRTMDLPSHVPSGKPRRGITNQTVTSQFQLSLTRLMEALNKADPYFIRCIKSNNSKTPGLFDEETVLRQLRYSGMLETVRIRQSGYHIRLTYKEFTSLYHALLPEDFRDDQNAFRRCFLHWGLDPENFQIGKRKIYLRETEKQKLDDILHKFVLRNIIRIQRWWRVSNHQLKEKSAVAIQRHWRGYVVRNDYRRTRVATLMIQRWWRAAQRRKSARRFARNVERKPAIMEEEDTNDEDLERVAASSSPLSHTTNGHATPFSSFSSDWNSNHSDDGISGPPLTKTTSTEDVRSPGRLIISIVPGSRTPLRRESYAAPDRFRRDSEEESSGILDDSEPESYQPHQFSKLKRDSRHEHAPAGFMVPRVEPKPWRRYSAIEPPPQHSVSEPQTPPAEKVQERGVDVFNEKPIDVYNEKGVDVKEEISQHVRPSPPRQIPLGHQRTTRRDTLPKREHFTVDPVLQQQQSGKGKMGVFKNWLEKKVAPKKKSLAGGDLESLRLSPDLDEADEEPRTILTRGSAGRTPMKSNAHNSLISRLSPPRKSFSPKTLAKRAKSASGKAAVFETSSTSSSSSILQPLQRTFSKNRLRRRIAADPESTGSQKSTSTKEQSWNCRSITEFTDSEDRVVSSAEELRELETFIFDKILQMDSGTKGKTSTKADQIFQQALKEFRNNLISTYSVAVKDVRLCIRYRDLIVNFEKTIRVACYKIIQSQSPPYTTAALAKYKTDADAFPVNLALNAFRSFMNEFMQRQQTKMKLDESTKYRTLSRKRKVEQSILNKNGHQLVSVNIFNLPTACEVCSSFLWPMEKGLVCQLCKTTCHKKCYQKIENSCTGKRKIKKSTTAGGALALPAQLGPSQPSGRIFCVPLDCLLLHGEKIPAIADRMITVIELQGVYTEWIYRKSGGIPGMRTLRAAIEENCEKIDWDQYHDSGIHVVASTFKALLREMPEPLMTFERYDEIMDIMENDNEEDQLQNVYVSIRKMPKSNHDLLERLFFHLARIAQHSDVNQMNAENLAIIFAPVLFKADRDLRAFEVSDNYKKQIKCIQIVIDAQLQKLQLTLEDIGQIDSAAMTANTRLSVIRSSKVYIGSSNTSTGTANIPETIPDVDEEEFRLSTEIQSLRKEKEKRTMDLASLRLSRQTSREASHSSEEDLSVAQQPAETWRRRRSSQATRRDHRRDLTLTNIKKDATEAEALVWL